MKRPETEELREWSARAGLSAPSREGLPDLISLIGMTAKSAREDPVESVEDAVDAMASYQVYLASEKARVAAHLGFMKSGFEQAVNSATEGMERQYVKYEEKRALAIRTDGSLREAWREISVLQAKLDRIGDLPRVIESKMQVLRRVLQRRLDEGRRG